MYDSQFELLSRFLMARLAEIAADPANAEAWSAASLALGGTREKEPDLAAAIDAHDAAALRAIAEQWALGKRQLPEHDREVLKRAMKAYRKSLKITQLDAESGIAGGPMSGGRPSGITGITPPVRYPREVWAELARQGRLIDARQGVYELPPGQ
ncbi:MAG TPA: hypothetical protein VK843_11080 [Planctomycetota bacterium]|nr:hypothetical protein [Planctomycetota bacterium]